jgi:hypothetical protein
VWYISMKEVNTVSNPQVEDIAQREGGGFALRFSRLILSFDSSRWLALVGHHHSN